MKRSVTNPRLIAKVTRDILRSSSFDNLADLADVLKRRLLRLRIRHAPHDISEAFAMIGDHNLVQTRKHR